MWQLQSKSLSFPGLCLKLFVAKLLTFSESVLMLPLTNSIVVPEKKGFYELSSGEQASGDAAAGSTLVGMSSEKQNLV